MEKIAAGIVLFNPDMERLAKNLIAIKNQVDFITIIDNASNNIENIENCLKEILRGKRYKYNRNEKNEGIARALNQVVYAATSDKCDWVVTLDQDSIVPENLVSEYLKYVHISQIGMLCPIIGDCNLEKENIAPKTTYEQTRRCITSGAMLKIVVYKEIGEFCNKLFIDYVDFEYNARMMKRGYKIIRVNTVILNHQLGKSQEVKLGNRMLITTNHNAKRRYYATRNRIYCLKKYHEYVDYKDVLKYLKNTPRLILKYEDNKIRKVLAIIGGVIAGIFMK